MCPPWRPSYNRRSMVIAVDVGTSSARASAYAADGRPVAGLYHQAPYEPRVTADGGVEHDPRVLLDAVATCLDAVCARAGRATILGVGLSTFWHGLCGFDAAGQAVTPVYMWADARSARDAGLLRSALDEAELHERTGCHLHSSYWPAKLRWFARERPAEARRVTRWGSFGEHLELTLFGEAATSVSMASATGLFDLAAGAWDAEALAAAGIEPHHLFRVVDRTEGRRGLRREWAARWPALHAVPGSPPSATAPPATSAPTAPSRTGSRSTSAPRPRCASPPTGPGHRRAASGATASIAAACCSAAPLPRAATCTRGAVRRSGCPTTRRSSGGSRRCPRTATASPCCRSWPASGRPAGAATVTARWPGCRSTRGRSRSCAPRWRRSRCAWRSSTVSSRRTPRART